MKVHLAVRNESKRKRLYRSDALRRLAERVCSEEGLKGEAELSVLFCDDAFIQELNRTYRKMDGPTDVLAFDQGAPTGHGVMVLGDIVISLETVERHCRGVREDMLREVRLLFCHGLLHLLSYDHATARDRERMAAQQAHYLDVGVEAAWPAALPGGARGASGRVRGGGSTRVGR